MIGPASVVIDATLTCPECGHMTDETMPTNACQFFFECSSCSTVIRPKQGDCCVFCSYSSAKCPPMQQGNCCSVS